MRLQKAIHRLTQSHMQGKSVVEVDLTSEMVRERLMHDHLRHLFVSHSPKLATQPPFQIGDAGVEQLCPVLAGAPLGTLTLLDNGITDRGATLLAIALKKVKMEVSCAAVTQ